MSRPRPSTPEEAIAFFASLPPSHIRLGLDRMEVALAALGHPEQKVPALHVAGTNGKGSTCAFAESCLRAAGHKVGLYTSPHLVRINERIRVDGLDISDAQLGQRILEVIERYPAIADEPYPITYFELGTLLAFWHFAQEAVEVAVLETGLGGRLDATTCCRPWVTAVSAISFDHMELLGDTLEKIAFEKAGIFKPGVPAVVQAQPAEVLAVFERRATEVVTSLREEGRDFFLERTETGFVYRGLRGTIELPSLGLRGDHQRHNAALALASIELLDARGISVPERALREGIASTRWPGRLEEVASSPTVVLDGAHNPAGVDSLVLALKELYRGRRVHLVFGVAADKDFAPMMERLFTRAESVHLCPLPNPRSLAPADCLEAARKLTGDVRAHPSIEAGLACARSLATGDDLVLCAGSLFLVGEVKALFAR